MAGPNNDMVDKLTSAGSGDDWRDKYLNALDAQEAMEQQLLQQQELLRRALVRISLSADGQDDKLDSALTALRERLRSGAGDLIPVFAQVDTALINFDQQREQTTAEIVTALSDTLSPLQKFNLPRSLSKEIRHYLAQLPERTQKIRLYPALLRQLADIQQRALAELELPPAPSLWGKLRGQTSAANAVKTTTSSVASATLLSESAPPTDEPIINLTTESAVNSVTITATTSVNTDSSTLIYNIQTLLTRLLTDINVPDEMSSRVTEIHASINQGLTSDNLFTSLEAVRDLVMEAYLLANKTFATYLNNVNQELADIYQLVGGAVDQQVSRIETAQQLQTSMMQQMSHLETGVSDATDLDQLKTMVKSQIGNIRQAINQFHQSDQEQQEFSAQLQELAAKIKDMEADAEKSRTSLEKHRYKSLHDPLTELPNREAYSERIQAEFYRWQRYQHPLSLAVFDLDYFKKINDNFGHHAGDRVLKVISRSIAKRLREVDFFGRYGGEEFVAILPETSLDKAHVLLEKIRLAIANTAFNYKNEPLSITLSIGITEFRPGDTIESVFVRADKTLYTAKSEGRNRCSIS